MEAILGDLKRILSQLGNLLDLGLPGRFEFAVVPMRATRGMKFLEVVDLVGAKRRTIDAAMSRLSALSIRPARNKRALRPGTRTGTARPSA